VDRLAFARAQMGMSLAFHIVFAAIGIALPLAIFVVEGLFLWSGEQHYLRLARRWAKVTGLLFAIGAISGTALSFELGLLWPKYMQVMGAAVGQAFGLEGFAFFIEGIFIGLYLYGWRRLKPVTHWLCAGVIALSGAASGALVLAVNAWMQLPVGFKMDAAGKVISTDPSAIFRTYAWVVMSIHSTLACYEAVPLLMAGIYAMALLKGRRDAYCRSAMLVCMSIGGIAAILQPMSGDAIAKFVYRTQPAKFAAMEAEFETRTHAPMHLGGFPDLKARTDRDSIEIPDLLSFLAAHDFSARVTGLNDIPQALWPNVRVVHWAFDLMAVCGTIIAIATIIFWVEFAVRRQRVFEIRTVLWMLVIVGPLGLVALEAGWFVTELGRQPWIIQGIMLTKDAVTPSAQVPFVFFAFALLYVSLAVIVILLIRRGKYAPGAESVEVLR
jgi:cytochrome d ubiquinol oxidase subunit I